MKPSTSIMGLRHCVLHRGRPPPELPYIEFQSSNGGQWRRVPLEARLIGGQSNLLTGPDAEGEAGLLTVEGKAARERNTSERLKRIVSEWNGC